MYGYFKLLIPTEFKWVLENWNPKLTDAKFQGAYNRPTPKILCKNLLLLSSAFNYYGCGVEAIKNLNLLGVKSITTNTKTIFVVICYFSLLFTFLFSSLERKKLKSVFLTTKNQQNAKKCQVFPRKWRVKTNACKKKALGSLKAKKKLQVIRIWPTQQNEHAKAACHQQEENMNE